MKIIGRNKIAPIHLSAGDTLVVSYTDNKTEQVLCTKTLDAAQAMTVDEALLFETTFENRRALRGMVLEVMK